MSVLPGLPPLTPFNHDLFSEALLVISDAEVLLGLLSRQRWGFFNDQGVAILIGDSVRAFDYSNDARVSNYPIEEGDFRSYNKVQTPYDVKFTFMKSGSISDRTMFLNTVNALLKSTILVNAVTPEIIYRNVNITHVDFRRTAQTGTTLLSVDIWCEEIRQAPALQFTNTKTNESAGVENDGTVQASTPDQTVTQATPTTPGSLSTDGGAQLTNGAGTEPPTGSPATGATITYDGNAGPATGTVASVGETGNYVLTDGSIVGKNLVNSIQPAGFTVVQ